MDHVKIQPFSMGDDLWEAACVRCDGTLVGTDSDLDNKLCGLCLTGPVVPLFTPPSQQGMGRDAYSMDDADPEIVNAILEGLTFSAPLWKERWVAALTIMKSNPGMGRREVADRVGVDIRTITRLLNREYQKTQKVPLRAEVIEKLMAGRINRINPTRYEMREAICRLIKQGATDRKVAALTGNTVSVVSGHRHRMAASGEFSLMLELRV